MNEEELLSRSGLIADEDGTRGSDRDPSFFPELDWFPKPFRGGDHDGTGEGKLLGTSKVSLVDVIVRETAQNSWDARMGSGPLEFGIRLRKLDGEAMKVLRKHVFTSGSEALALGKSLAKEGMWVLEIHDRGTSGLNGPIRNDRRYERDQPTNFVDLVLSVGSPQDKAGGGGTYGFGKTAAFKASEASTVIYWSHSLEHQSVESRFIASGIGPSFDRDDNRFTGRHWWGRTSADGERPEPIVGPEADRLGRALFATGFDLGATGTSILVLDPILDVGEDGEPVEPHAYMDRVRDSVLVNLWPKLMRDSGKRGMTIRLGYNDSDVELPDPEAEPVLHPFVECLRAVRNAQGDVLTGVSPSVVVKEIRSLRPPALLGHLALVKCPVGLNARDIGFGEISHHVCVMRHEAELVVKYMDMRPLDVSGYQWAGVFKPTAETDASFAAAEPPTHDEWNSGSLKRPDSVYVNVGLRRIDALAKDFLSPVMLTSDGGGGETPSVVNLANRLAGFVGSTTANGATPRDRKHPRRSATNRRRPRVEVGEVVDLAWVDGWHDFAAEIKVSGGGTGAVRLQATAGVLVEGGARDTDDAVALVTGWSERPEDVPANGTMARMARVGAARWVHVHCREDLAIDLRVDVESE